MNHQIAKEEYMQALKQGQKEYKALLALGKTPNPAVLDEILEDCSTDFVTDIGLVEIPTSRIIGTKSAGRISAFTATFQPLLGPNSEFAFKWISLCEAHLSDEGIRDPIICYEYLGNFYVQEGNKRVSVLRHFGAARIPGNVLRIIPPMSDEPRIKAYYEFLEFYNITKLYTIQYRHPGDYDRLLAYLGKPADEVWLESERRNFIAYYQYFLEAFEACQETMADHSSDILPEEALLLWLQVHPYVHLGQMSSMQLKSSLLALWDDMLTSTQQSQLTVETKPVDESKNLFSWILPNSNVGHINVAFVHPLNTITSGWVQGHEAGKAYIEEVFGKRITVKSYYDANTPDEALDKLEQAVADGAQLVFTTAPQLSRATLKIAVKYPKVHFLNCSVNQPYSSVQTYYGRIYEGKFITGAIAGAMAQNDRIGYIGSNPIFGVPAAINAFALGAQMTNPRVKIDLRWSCCAGNHLTDFLNEGIRVISNRDMPTQDTRYTGYSSFGAYLMNDDGTMSPLASPVWLWGKFYEYVIRSMLAGTWKDGKSTMPKAVNYWLGMDSGVVGVKLGDDLPVGVEMLAKYLKDGIRSHTIYPFRRKIVAQDGSIKNDGTRHFTPDELLCMDWLCDNVIGSIPPFDQILPISQSIVRELGVYRDEIPVIKEMLP